MDTLTGTNDQTNLNAAADYEGYRAKAQKKETDDWFASQVGATPAPAKPAPAQDPDAAAPVGASGAPIPVPPGADAAEGEDASQAPENAQSVEDDEPTRTRKTLDMVGGVAKDILIGARESVPQVAGGVLDAVNEVLQLGNELGDAFNLPSTILDVDDKVPGEFFVNREQYEGAGGEVRPLSLPTTEGADSNTGQFIRSTSQFLTGFVPALRAMKGVKAVGVMKTPFAKEMAAGAIADAVAFDPYGDRLSTYLNQVPVLGAIVPDYLADNDPENESSWEGRMKNAVEGMGLGAAAEGLVRAFKYYKAQKKALDAAGIEAKSINDIQVQAGRDAMKNASSADLTNPISVDDLADLGDENGDMFVVAPDGTMSAGHAFRAHRDVREIMQTVPENVRSKVEEKINNFQGTADERGEYVGATKTIALQLDYLRKSLDTTVAEAEKLDGQKLKFNTQKQGKIKSRIARLEGALVKNTSVEGLKREAAYLGAIETADARVNADLGMDVINDAQMRAVAEADKFRTIDGRNFYYGSEDAAGGANAGAKGAAKKPAKIYLNMARIKTGEDVRQVLQEMADMDADAINAKRGETVTNAETTAAAKKHYQDLNDLIGREPGPMSASQAVAARKLLTSSGEQLVELARAARAPDATPADLFKFRRGMAVHYAIQSEVIAARTETARALQSWAIPTGSDKMRAQAINDLISNAGGSGDMQKVAAAIAQLNNPTALNVAVGEAMSARLGKAFYQAWINGLLSSPKTHMVNVLSNSLASVWAIPENYLAAGMSKAFYDGEIDAGEAAARAFGLAKGVRDAVLLTARGQKAANMEGVADLFETFTKADIDHENHISAQAFGLDPSGGIGYGIDLLGRAINVPSNLLAKEDTFFKAVNYRMELHTLAYRTAAGEGLEGQEMASRMADMMLNPPADLKAEALEAAHYRTFTSPLGERGQAFTNFVNKVPGARFVVPFIRTPINIMKYTFARTPLAYASAKIRADIAAGGARAATAHARVAVGSMLMLTVADLVMDGVVTGAAPKDPAIADDWKRKHPEYSVKIGDKWYAYGRLDPIGMLMGLGADIGQITQNTDVEDGGKLVTAGLAAMSNNLASKTWLSGVYDFIAAINPNDPTSDPSKYLANMAGTVLPYSSFIRSVTTAADPVIRDTRGRPAEGAIPEALQGMPEPVQEYMAQLMNTYTKNIPGLSDNLPPVKDLWGNDISRASGFGVPFDMLSPVAVRDVKDDAVDKVIVDNRIRLSHPDRLIQGVKLTGEEYASYVELAGKPAKEKLDQLVKSPGFSKMSDGPDGMKAQAIMNVVNAYRQAAQGQMLVLYPELREQVLKRKTERATALTGAGE